MAHRLFTAGHRVVFHDGLEPTVSRQTMACTDSIFDGRCEHDLLDCIDLVDLFL